MGSTRQLIPALIVTCALVLVSGCAKPLAPEKPKSAQKLANKDFRTPIQPAVKKEKSRGAKKEKAQKQPKENILINFPCQDRRCEEAYRNFSVQHAAHSKPVGKDTPTKWLRKNRKKKAPPATGMAPAALKETLIEAMNIGFLIDDLDAKRKVRVHFKDDKNPHYREEILEIIDPHVGRFGLLVLIPKKRVKETAILAIHGHGDNPITMGRKYHGNRLARDGHVVVLPKIRALDCMRKESTEGEISIELWANGFSMIGLYVYEALVIQHVLNQRADLGIKKWGILGHSGGSSIGNLLVRISSDFLVKVVDYQVEFNNGCGKRRVHCESFAPLFPYSKDINDETTLTIPNLRLRYGFHHKEKEISQFFEKHL
jgi:hypothetical protein